MFPAITFLLINFWGQIKLASVLEGLNFLLLFILRRDCKVFLKIRSFFKWLDLRENLYFEILLENFTKTFSNPLPEALKKVLDFLYKHLYLKRSIYIVRVFILMSIVVRMKILKKKVLYE